MKKHLVAAGVAMAVGLLISPTAALGAKVPGSEGGFVTLNELDSGGKVVSVPVQAGGAVPVTVGVAYNGNVSPQGAVVRLSLDLDLRLQRFFGNCYYYSRDGSEGAWCQFDETLQMGTPYLLSPFKVTAAANATDDTIEGVTFEVYGANYGSELGGIKGLADRDAGEGASSVKGGAGTLKLTTTDKLVMKNSPPVGFAPVHLVPPPPPSTPLPPDFPGKPEPGPATTPPTKPTSKPTATRTTGAPTTPTSAPTSSAPAGPVAAPAPPAGAGGAAGDLATTGSKTAVFAGFGVLLVLAGGLSALVVRRRRTRFVA